MLEITLSRVSGYRRSRRGRDNAPFIRFYEKVIKVKADVAALLIFFPDIDDAASGGVEGCQGRRFFGVHLDP